MEKKQEQFLTYPEGLDETKLDGLIQAIIDGVDREKLFQEPRLRRVRHPLLQERIGKDVALNVEISNLISNSAVALTTSDRISNKEHLIENAQRAEDILFQAANDMQALKANLDTLKAMVTRLAKLNPDADYFRFSALVKSMIEKRLKMPSAVQNYVLYCPVTADSLGETREEVLKIIEECRDILLRNVDGDLSDDRFSDVDKEFLRNFRTNVTTETTAVREWYERQAA